ncbi:MAG: NAD-dependent dehydratase [Bellilinea sp.]|nr:MAG: NAD-dependent dehydratase [Bellilinea sp.]
MKILIAGGSGLIGSALARHYLEKGQEVYILSRRGSSAVLPAGAKGVEWDAQSARGWGDLMNEMDVVINLTGENLGAGRWTEQRKQRFYTSRIQSGKALIEAMRQAVRKPGVLVQSSAVGYYGDGGEQVLDESSPPGKDFLAGLCVDWEDSTREAEFMGVRRIVLRTGVVLAEGADVLNRLLLPFRLFVGGPLGNGKQWLPWIHMADVVGAVDFLVENPNLAGVFNLSAPQPVQNATFGKTLARILRRPYWLPAPAFALKLLLGEMSKLVLEGQRAIPKRLIEAGYPFRFSEHEAALRDLLVKG